MKVVHFTNNLRDGAGRSAYRVHKALLEQGIDSLMLVFSGDTSDRSVIRVPASHPNFQIDGSPNNFLKFFYYHIPFIGCKVYWRLRLNIWKPLSIFNFNISVI